MAFESLEISRRGRVVTIAFDRPASLNAFDAVLHTEFARAIIDVAQEPDAPCDLCFIGIDQHLTRRTNDDRKLVGRNVELVQHVVRFSMLDRIEKLQQAVKFAREEANGADVTDQRVGDAVFGYLFG